MESAPPSFQGSTEFLRKNWRQQRSAEHGQLSSQRASLFSGAPQANQEQSNSAEQRDPRPRQNLAPQHGREAQACQHRWRPTTLSQHP